MKALLARGILRHNGGTVVYQVTSGGPRWLMLGRPLILFFINDLACILKPPSVYFADHVEMAGIARSDLDSDIWAALDCACSCDLRDESEGRLLVRATESLTEPQDHELFTVNAVGRVKNLRVSITLTYKWAG